MVEKILYLAWMQKNTNLLIDILHSIHRTKKTKWISTYIWYPKRVAKDAIWKEPFAVKKKKILNKIK